MGFMAVIQYFQANCDDTDLHNGSYLVSLALTIPSAMD